MVKDIPGGPMDLAMDCEKVERCSYYDMEDKLSSSSTLLEFGRVGQRSSRPPRDYSVQEADGTDNQQENYQTTSHYIRVRGIA